MFRYLHKTAHYCILLHPIAHYCILLHPIASYCIPLCTIAPSCIPLCTIVSDSIVHSASYSTLFRPSPAPDWSRFCPALLIPPCMINGPGFCGFPPWIMWIMDIIHRLIETSDKNCLLSRLLSNFPLKYCCRRI